MPASYPMKKTKYHHLHGYQPVIELITDTYVFNVNNINSGKHVITYEYFYKNDSYHSLDLAMHARQREVDEDNKETISYQTQITEHSEQGLETIYQYSKYKITSVKDVEKHRELISDVFQVFRLEYATLSEAKQKRKSYADNKRKQQQINEHALEALATSGQQSIDELLKAIGLIKDIIKLNPSDEHRYAIQLKGLTTTYEAEKIAYQAELLESKLKDISLEHRPAQIQKIKDLYAMAIELKTAKQLYYKQKRAKISQDKIVIEEKIAELNNQEHQLHQSAKAAARVCNDNPSTENFEIALKAYDEVIELKTKDIEIYKAERRVIYSASQSFQNELDLHQIALHQAALAKQNPSIENFKLTLKKYDDVIALETNNINLYKSERRVIYRAYELHQEELVLHEEALRLASNARQNPSLENFHLALRQYNQLIEKVDNQPRYIVERTTLERDKNQFLSDQKDRALQTIRQMRTQIANQNPQQRLLQHRAIIEYCEACTLGLNLQTFINDARQAIQLEQSILDKYAQAQQLLANITTFNGQARIENYQIIIDLLVDIISANTNEKNMYQNLKEDVISFKNAYQQDMQQNIIDQLQFDINQLPVNHVDDEQINFVDEDIDLNIPQQQQHFSLNA